MSNSFDNCLANAADVTIEPVSKGDTVQPSEKAQLDGKEVGSQEMMDGHQTGNEDCSEESNGDRSENGRRKKAVAPMRTDEIEEIRTEGSADDMDLDETIDSHIGVRMETESQHIRSLPSDDNEEEEEEEDDDIGIDSVNILDTLPLEGAPIEGQEVSESDLLGKIDDDDDDDEEKSLSRSGEEDSMDSSKRRTEHDGELDPAKKKVKKEDGAEGSNEMESKSDKKLSNMRRNIREVMDETQLDEATLSAQRQEMERLRRVQEQQRIIREVQRRQNNRGTSLLRSNQNLEDSEEVRLPNTVMMKVNSSAAASGQASVAQQAGVVPRRPMAESSRYPRGGRGGYQGAQTSISRVPAARNNTAPNVLQQRIRMMTPSVSISPVVPKKEPIEHLEYYTDSDLSDVDPEAEESVIQDKQIQQARKLSGSAKTGQKQAKGKDVVTISSSSESSDDDCIVLSDPSEVEETDNEEDPSNSGMHTNDRYNIPDEQGRVLVNVGHPDDEPDVFLAPQVARIIKPHQIGGIRFLYDNIVESIERFKTSSGFGCILAHSMGLGKTLQVASFCDIFFRCTTSKTVLCIMPINTLQNWLAEFNMWLPYEDPNKPKVEEKPPVKEESNQSDMSYMSRPGSELDPANQHHPPGMMPENNPYGHHGYNSNLVPPYGPPGAMYDPRYGPTYPTAGGYPIKTEPSCHPQQMNPGMNPYGMDNRGMPQYPGYPSNMQHPSGIQQPPGMQHPGYPGMDPNMHSNMNPHGASQMYPGYGTNPNMPYPNYGGQQQPPRLDGQEIKKENNLLSEQGANGCNRINVKPEIKEETKKDSEELKKENMNEKKEEIVKTPYSVDAPSDIEIRPRHFSLHILNDSHKTMAARARVIREWQKVGGVLLIGYELYRQLSLKKPNKAKRKRGQPFKDPMIDAEEEDKNKPLLDEMHSALVNPGPDLVICDEGHRIKNSHASISLALKQMRTKRRIVLTGYPLQNNLLEYWCMVDFVRPNYLGTKSEFCNMFERPIQNGQCIDSTPQDIRLMRYRAHVLHALLEGFVQRRSHSVLQVSLPRKEEYILLVRMTPHQRKLYDTFMNQVVKTRAVPNPLKAFAVCCKIWNHPDILYHFLKKRQANEEDDLDLEETMGDKASGAAGAKRASKPRALKGESKKGKKANVKSKPAASVQPNSTSMSSENPEADPQKQQQQQQQQQQQSGFSNFNPPAPPPPPMANAPGFSHATAQNNYQQQQQQQQQTQQHTGYQNYRPDDHTSNYHGGEYNDYYANQNQKYPQTENQNYPPYVQNTNYSGNSQAQPHQQQQQQQSQHQQQPQHQQYQAQQNYNIPPNDSAAVAGTHGQRFPGPSPTGPTSTSNAPNFRPDQSQAMAGATGGFPRPNYPYQEQDRNYPANMNQGQNYQSLPNQQQQSQQQQSDFQSQSQVNQVSNQIGMTDYGSYPQQNQSQGYSATAQPMQNNAMNYPTAGQQQTSNETMSNASQGYMNNQQQNASVFPQSQQMQNPSMPNSTHQPYSNSAVQQPNQQSVSAIPNQQHGYPVNQAGTPNPMTGMGYTQNQQEQQPAQQQPTQQQPPPTQQQQQQPQHGYQANMPQNQIKGYQNVPQSQTSSYSIPNQQNQQHGYPNEPQQHQQSQQQYQHQQQSASYPGGNQAQQQPQPQPQPQPQQQQQQQQQQHQQQHQQHGYNQHTPAFSPTQQPQQVPSGQIAYPPNQSAPATPTNQVAMSYPPNAQQSQPASHAQNQPMSYPPNTQSRNKIVNPNEQQQQQQQGYSQNTQNLGGNYPVTPATPQSYPPSTAQTPTSSQMPNNPQQQPPAQGQDQYWQRNYPNDPYYNDSTVNQYQSTQYNNQSNVAASGNYQGDQQNQQTQQSQQNPQNQYQNYPANNNMLDQKPPQHMQNSVQPSNPNVPHGTQTQVLPQPNNNVLSSSYNSVNPTPDVPNSMHNNQGTGAPIKEEDKEKDENTDKDNTIEKDKDKDDKSDDEIILKDEAEKDKNSPGIIAAMSNIKDDPGIPYDWATELMKGYVPGMIDASAKMSIFFCILEEAIRLTDRVLAFSQSLFTLNLIEDFLARNPFKYADGQTESWAKNVNYYRLDGSTSALEREKLINEFNVNPKVHLFLVSTRAGSLGINLVGANRAIVFDASWNPCHDTQAVCRVYRYGQRKNCYVYRLVTDNCLERKIYDRQISKQGMADRVVDQCNPDAHLSLKEATTLSWDWEEDSQVQDFSDAKDKYPDEVMHILLEKYSSLLTKQPFHHESLLVDRKDKKLSQAEKRLARRGYELEKMAANCSRPSYNYVPGNTAARVSVQSGSLQIRQIRGDGSGPAPKPVASVRPMQQRGADGLNARNPSGSRWIPAEVWQRQGMSAQEMTLPLDVVIPTNSPDKGSIVLKAGQRVMVLKSPKGIYMQLESGKIIAIRTALKINQQKKDEEPPKKSIAPIPQRNTNNKEIGFPLRNNSAISIIPKSSTSNAQTQQNRSLVKTGVNYRPFGEKEVAKRTSKPVVTAAAKPYSSQINVNQVSLSRINKHKQDNPNDFASMGENSNSSDSQKVRCEQRVEEVRIEDVVNESGSNSEYSPSSRPSNSDTDTNMPRPMMENKMTSNFPIQSSPARPQGIRTPQDRDMYMTDPKVNAHKKFEMNRPGFRKDKKTDGSDEIIIEDPSQHQHSQHQHLHQQHSHPSQQQHPNQHQPVHQPIPHHPQPTRTQPRPISQHSSGVPRVTSDVILSGGKNHNNPSSNHNLTSPSVTRPPTVSTSSRSKPTSVEPTASRDPTIPSDQTHGLPQGYPYAQYPRYYDYADPRSRPLTDPYGSYFPPVPSPHTATNLPRATSESSSAPQPPPAPLHQHSKPVNTDETPKPSNESASTAYSRVNAIPSKNSHVPEVSSETPAAKSIDPASHPSSTSASSASAPVRDEPHVPTAFSHPSSVRSAYPPGPYPPTPYDPYSQHYPPAPASSAAYSAGAAPGYPAYGGPSYNADYARMYSAFHGPPPPAADPYLQRSYAPPPASHPSNYYPPFPHPPPPPYPNYSFLPPYPNPNVPTEPQPPAQ